MRPLNVLLLNIPNENEIEGNDPPILKRHGGFYPPLGLMYIASYLKKYTKHKVELLDCQALRVDYVNLAIYLSNKQFDVIGITSITLGLMDLKMTIMLIKEVSPDTEIVVGGPHATIYPDETARLGADKIVIGEGEKAMATAILEPYSILFKGSSTDNLDLIPFPYRTHNDKYYSILTPEPMTTMFSSRGCPYQCNFCDRPAMGKKFRARSPENVVDEMEECVQQEIKEILFYDDTFTVDRERVFDICSEIVRRNLKVKWDVRARVDTVDEIMMCPMAKAGCNRIHFGVESGVQRVIDNLNKGITLEQVNNAFKWAKEADIKTFAYFMIGNPGETKEDINESCLFSKRLDPDFTQFTIFTPFPATKSFADWCERNDKDVWQEFALRPTQDFQPPVWNEYLSREDLRGIISKIYKAHYLHPRSIWNKVRGVRSYKQLKRYIHAGLELIK